MPVRRGPLATPAFTERVSLRHALLTRYVADPAFRAALTTFVEGHVEHAPAMPRWRVLAHQADTGYRMWPDELEDQQAAESYVAAMRKLVASWGLDRFLGRPTDFGADQVHKWCRRRQVEGLAYSLEWLAAVAEAQYQPAIGEVIERAIHDLGDISVVEEHVRPVVRIQVVSQWDPQREPRAGARKRLRSLADEAIQAELDRLANDAETKGYRFVDYSPERERDLKWLFVLMTGRASFAEIVERAGGGTATADATVSKAVRRIASKAGVSTIGFNLRR